MSDAERIDLVALAWLWRGDADVEGWRELRREAVRVHNRRTAAYLLAMPHNSLVSKVATAILAGLAPRVTLQRYEQCAISFTK
jgi:hypothetical protein